MGVVGPAGAWGEGLALEVLALHLRAAARVYAQVEASVAALMSGVGAGADLAARGGWLTDGTSVPVVTVVAPTLVLDRDHGFLGAADLVAAGEGLDGGRVRVVEVARGDGGSAWVVIVPGTQEWSPRAGANPFDVTTDVRAVTGDATLAAAGVTAALEVARGRIRRAIEGGRPGGARRPQPGRHPGRGARERPGVHPAPPGHPRRHQWRTGRAAPGAPHHRGAVRRAGRRPGAAARPHAQPGPPVVGHRAHPGQRRRPSIVGAHRLEGYVATLRVAEGAPRGTIDGLDAWQASAGVVLGRPVRSVSEVVIERAAAGAGRGVPRQT